jgi:hypothetical protein
VCAVFFKKKFKKLRKVEEKGGKKKERKSKAQKRCAKERSTSSLLLLWASPVESLFLKSLSALGAPSLSLSLSLFFPDLRWDTTSLFWHVHVKISGCSFL